MAGQMRSVEASRAIWANVDVKGSELLVLQALASFANDDFECWPSVARLSQMTKVCPRQIKRILQQLRAKGLIAFEDNRGGKHKTTHYCLLIANGDICNSDICKGDISNGDKSTTQTVTFSHPNGDILSANGDILSANGDTAMSPEGFEWFEGIEGKDQWGESISFSHFSEAFEEITEDIDPEELLKQILNGVPVERNEQCDLHGPFTRPGFRFGKWLAWAGHQNVYSSHWTHDTGCDGCRKHHEDFIKQKTNVAWPIRHFELRTPAFCPEHGKFIIEALLTERSKEWEEHGQRRIDVMSEKYNGLCPGCEQDWIEASDLMHQLDLSVEEWERGGKQILAALEYARSGGENDNDE
jgi:hypothetical protein